MLPIGAPQPRKSNPFFRHVALSTLALSAVGLLFTDASAAEPSAALLVDRQQPAAINGAAGALGISVALNIVPEDLTLLAPQSGLFVRSIGGAGGDSDGSSGGRGGDGGTASIQYAGKLVIQGNGVAGSSAIGTNPGVYDDDGGVFGLYAASAGGRGGNALSSVLGGGSGGTGGRAQAVMISNGGSITLDAALPYGAAGIYGGSVGGRGGNQDDEALGDQVGGDGNNGGTVSIDNRGAITVRTSQGGRFAWGVAAESLGNLAGLNASSGGSGEFVAVTNSGAIDVSTQSATFSNGVRGVSASSIGAAGSTSQDGSDDGGPGGFFYGVNVSHTASAKVVSRGLFKPVDLSGVSGGIVAIAAGGLGGDGPDTPTNTTGEKAGAGGSFFATPNVSKAVTVLIGDAASVATDGDYLPGVAAIAQGGVGGAGRSESSGASGGASGAVQVDVNGNAQITTNGTSSFGVLARAQGGDGGVVRASSGVVNVASQAAGRGGAAGAVDLTVGSSGGAVVYTSGPHASALAAQSLGGAGGGSSSSFELFVNTPVGVGQGGSPGRVSVSSGARLNTEGDYAHGIVAQSIGGGGGVAGESNGIIGVGARGGQGAVGGEVFVYQSNAIGTLGTAAIGILSQSIGGGGGDGGNANGVIGVGGQGGTGGDAGRPDLTLKDSTIGTKGDFAYGVVTQSIGGGGGNGGDVITVSAGVPPIGIGGTGGAAGTGNTASVSVDNATLTTVGDNAHGIVTQSVGGGGGVGGNARGVALAPASFQMAGGGGKGGSAGSASIDADRLALSTLGSHASGVIVQSIGGGGGTGGSAASVDAFAGFAASASVGGSGTGAGQGGTAAASLSNSTITTGRVATTATDAHGLLVQSIGGGGGVAGGSFSKAFAVAVPVGDVTVGAAASASVGGTGGDGGAAGTASGMLDASSITTYGSGSHGALVQSIGGGGGVGGSASSAAGVLGISESTEVSLSTALGGSGGKGGDGAAASLALTNGSAIKTFGDFANAALVQSIGGGGGNAAIGSASATNRRAGGNLGITLGLGGKGDSAGQGGAVSLTTSQDSSLITQGDGARGALLQSIGGGGGNSQGGSFGLEAVIPSSTSEPTGTAGAPSTGGSAAGNGDSAASGPTTLSATIQIGRTGANGGSGGAIALYVDGTISTAGVDADGLTAQSIGGGGGLGGSVGETKSASDSEGSGGESESDDNGSSYGLNLSVGGSGGGAGRGGDIGSAAQPARLAARIVTLGDFADGIVLQSIGGGGGQGGTAAVASSSAKTSLALSLGGAGGTGLDGGNVYVNFDDSADGASVDTSGYAAHGVVIQTIGGGGGMAASRSPRVKGTINLARNGGSNGNGGNITITNGWLASATRGDDAHAVILQSIGSGGGIASVGSSAGDAMPGASALAVTLGGNSRTTGIGGAVTLTTGVNLITRGDRSVGLIAQSIGGGGGIATGPAANFSAIELGMGGANGGTVNLNLTRSSSVSTTGAGAHGIIAQSIGGSGGLVGDLSQKTQLTNGTLRKGGTGNGAAVSVVVDGTVKTQGANAHGVVAQSLGDGGVFGSIPGQGLAGSTNAVGTGLSGNVSVDVKDVMATGVGSTAVFAQSAAGQFDFNGNIDVNINGNVVGGSGPDGSGVWLVSGKSNTLRVNPGASLAAASGVAVRYTVERADAPTARLAVFNSGTIDGDILCSGGSATPCDVENTGTLQGATRYEANVQNAGTLLIGKPGTFSELTVAGNFTQASAGVLRAEVDFAGMRSSQLIVQGNAVLNGALDVVPTTVLPNRELAIVRVAGTSSGALQAIDSPIFDYDARQVGQDHAIRVVGASFDAPALGLPDGQSSLARYLQRGWDRGGSPELARLYGALDLAARGGAGDYRRSLSDLSPGVSLAPAAQMHSGMTRFANAMLSCPVFDGQNASMRERDCFWGQVTGRTTSGGGAGSVSDYSYDSVTYQVGGQKQVSPTWFVGGSAAYQDATLRGDDRRVRGDGDTGYAGLVVKKEAGPWTYSGAVSAGYGKYDLTRNINVAGYGSSATSRPDVFSYGTRLRVARTFAADAYYVKPYVDFDATYSRMPKYSEGGDALKLNVDGSDQFVMALSPMLEIGGRRALDNGAEMRPYAYAGVSFLSRDEFKVNTRLAGAPAGSGSFRTSLKTDNVIGRLGGGIQLFTAKGWSFKVEYDGEFGSNLQSHAGSLKAMMPF